MTPSSPSEPIMLDATMQRIHLIEARLDQGAERMDRMQGKLDKTAEDVSEVLEILQSARGFFKVAGGIGLVVKWLAGMAAALAALWAFWHNPPK